MSFSISTTSYFMQVDLSNQLHRKCEKNTVTKTQSALKCWFLLAAWMVWASSSTHFETSTAKSGKRKEQKNKIKIRDPYFECLRCEHLRQIRFFTLTIWWKARHKQSKRSRLKISFCQWSASLIRILPPAQTVLCSLRGTTLIKGRRPR